MAVCEGMTNASPLRPLLHFKAAYAAAQHGDKEMIRTFTLFVVLISIMGCSDGNAPEPDESAQSNQVSLPEGPNDRVKLTGEMSFWMYEGAAGCYGAFVSQGKEVQVWVDADTCGDREYAENQPATLVLTFNPENQYGPGTTYTITSFE
tara:strand:- start:38629 stop:39075 length:447 start_codon:yes stop_codon:yes gene_type:complete